MSIVVSGPKRFLVVLFYCAKLPMRTQPDGNIRSASEQRLPSPIQPPMNGALLRQFRLYKRIMDRVIGITLIMADSKQLDPLGELTCLQ